MKLTFHTDPSHGWLFVSNHNMMKLRLNSKSLSRYSYRDNSGVYAEEDCDAAIIIRAAEERNILKVVINSSALFSSSFFLLRTSFFHERCFANSIKTRVRFS